MDLKKLLILGKTIKYALYIAFGAYCFKIFFTVILGMYVLKVKNAGPMFYYWQTTQCNKETVKSFYKHIPRNAEHVNTLFTTYIDNVQFSDKDAEIIKENKKILDKTLHKPYSLENQNGTVPLYADGGFFEPFAIGSMKNHRIFKNKKEPEDLSWLHKELEFLTFRKAFIEYIKSKNPNMKGFELVEKTDLDAFFDSSKSVLVSEEGDVTGLNGEKYKVVPAYSNGINLYRGIYGDFKKIVDALKNDEDVFEMVDAYNLKVNDKVMPIFIRILKNLDLADLIVGPEADKDDERLKAAIDGFITRMAVIKPTYIDIHFFNKIVSYFFFTHSHLGQEEDLLNNKEYADLSKEAEKIQKLSTIPKNIEVKLANIFKKMALLRNSLILDYFSELLANNMGKSGFLLNSEDDARLPFFSLFAYPGLFNKNEENEKRYTSIFSH